MISYRGIELGLPVDKVKELLNSDRLDFEPLEVRVWPQKKGQHVGGTDGIYQTFSRTSRYVLGFISTLSGLYHEDIPLNGEASFSPESQILYHIVVHGPNRPIEDLSGPHDLLIKALTAKYGEPLPSSQSTISMFSNWSKYAGNHVWRSEAVYLSVHLDKYGTGQEIRMEFLSTTLLARAVEETEVAKERHREAEIRGFREDDPNVSKIMDQL